MGSVSILINHLTLKEIKLNNSHSHIILLIMMVGMLLISSCSINKNLPEGDKVYMGAEININDLEEAKSIREFKYTLKAIPQAGTQSGVGNLKIGIHNIFAETREKGFKHWVKYKIGSKPIIYKPDMIDITEAKLEYYLKGKGFFSHQVGCEATETKYKTNISCDVTLRHRHRIDSLIFPIDTVYATLDLDDASKRMILKENDFYDRDRLEYERLRITSLAGSKGYADFKSTNVHFYVDTVKVDNTVDVYTQIISPTDSTKHIRYTLDSILVFPNYSKRSKSLNNAVSTNLANRITVFETQPYLNHALFEKLILEDPNGYYNRTQQYRTTKRFQNLGIFQAINIVNEPSVSGQPDHITQKIFLTPVDMQSVSGEFEVNNRSGNTFGVGASVAYQNRNLLGNAENLNVSVGGQVETQFGDGVSLINSADFNAKVELNIPRFIIPIIKVKEKKNFLPRTVIKAEYTLQRRTELYSIESFTAKFGYRWRQSNSKLHEFYPININEINVTNQTQEFLDLINQDIRLQRSFTDVLIGGLQYYYTYTRNSKSSERGSNYLRMGFETSGNLLSTIIGADQVNPVSIAGVDYAQFSKMTLDFRKYWSFGETDLATRCILGAGVAYGNSQEMPYTKQYFVGGSNSLRAFRIRGLGPGSVYTDPNGLTVVQSQFVDQTGDMKLEMNIEYRIPIFKYLKGAVFVDAGNVWLIDSQDLPAQNFEFAQFYKEIAIGTGIGFRLDFDFFVLRLDTAFPVRAPTANGFRWVLSDFDIGSKSWRQNNLRFNLGIGYPF